MATHLEFRPLTSDEVAAMFEKCLVFLSKRGVRVEHDGALEMLERAGADVDAGSQIVRFPLEVIMAALSSVPKDILMAGVDQRHDCTIRHAEQRFFVATATGNVTYLDPLTGEYCDVGMSFVREWAQLCQALDNIDMVFFPFATDAPRQTADIHALKATLENTAKHVIIQPYSIDSLRSLFEMGAAVAGGSEALRQRPVISMVVCALSPFTFKPMDIEALILSTSFGVPIYAASLPSAGGTSPVTIAGTVLQNGIECLASLTMSQLFKPGSPFIGNPVVFAIDMASGNSFLAGVDAEICEAACTQFIKEAFKIPTAPFGYATDSVVPDGQSIANRLLLGLMVSNAGADIIAEAGHLGAGMIASPVQLIIDDTLAAMLRRVGQGVKVDEEELAWAELLEKAPGSHYMESEHTLRHCRDALRLTLFSNQSRNAWQASGSKDLLARATDRYREIKAGFGQYGVPSDVQSELDAILLRADKSLVR